MSIRANILLLAVFVFLSVIGANAATYTVTKVADTNDGSTSLVDVFAPSITYTPFANTLSVADRVLFVILTDETGVATGGLTPRIYYKKNNGGYLPENCTLFGGTAQNGTWNCTIVVADMGGMVATDVVSYFVVAQDTLGNLAANPSAGFVGTNVNTFTIPPTTPNTYTIANPLFVVDNTTDNGSLTACTAAAANDCSLRGAISRANSSTDNDTISFDATVFSSAQTITLGGSELSVANNGSLTINGTGANLLTISGNNLSRVFSVNGGDLTFSGLTVSRGNASGGNGGGILNMGILTITDSTIRDSVGQLGGGINNANNSGFFVTLTNVTITGNSANNGGGINNGGIGIGGTVTLTNSNVFGNTSGNLGGGIFNFSGAIILTNTNVTANNAAASGGGIGNLSGTVTITNSNISRNVAAFSNGGGIYHDNGGNMTVINSTVSNNRAALQGGGIYSATTGSTTLINATISENSSGTSGGGIAILQGTPTFRNTIISDNINNGSPNDIQGTINSQGYNLVSNTSGSGINGTLTGNILGQSAQLTPLGNYGGATQTRKLMANSPAIDAGSNALAVDGNNQPLTTDQRGAGFPRIINTTVDMGATERFPSLDLTVDTTSDNGSLTACTAAANDCSLRGAISRANGSAGDDTIAFDATVFATGQTITLGGSELSINNNGGLTITGTGVNLLHINGNNQSRVFLINPNSYVAISGMTVRNGNGVGAFSGYGGGIANSMGQLTLTAVTVSGNIATIDGGGIAGDGVTTLVNSSVNGNSANSSGGGIASSTGGTLNITNSTVNGNTAGFINGGIVSTGIMNITGSTISNNTCLSTIGSTGGIGTTNDTVITNSTISGNTIPNGTSNSGGGIWANGNLTVINSTITDNQGFDIGGIRNAGSATFILRNTIVAGNRNSATVPEVVGAFTANNNLIGNAGTATGFTGNGNLTNAIPRLLALGNYGGTTQTHALAPTSPAINAGTSTGAPTLDQRGAARVGNVDIGAFEAPTSLVVTNTSDNGAGSLRSAVAAANANPFFDNITFNILSSDAGCISGVCTITLTSGELAIANSIINIVGTGANLLTVSGNNASRIFNISTGANVIFSGLTISRGNAGDGGAISNDGFLTINDSVIKNSTAQFGGGFRNGNTVTLTNVTITGNSAFGGGGIHNGGGAVTMTNSNVSGNTSSNDAGGIFNSSGYVTLTNTTVNGNTALGTGGVVNLGGVLTITSSTISRNVGTFGDGGIGNTSGTLTVANSTISGNSGRTGGGIFTATFATVTLTNSTITGNSASNGGSGISILQGVPNIRNMIIAGNISAVGDVRGTVNSQGYNLIGNASATIINGDTTGNILNQNARLAPLGFYGGTTETHALLSGSPAVNAADSANVITLDQRGAARVGNVDMGAFELNSNQNGGNFVAVLPNGTQGMSYNFTLIPEAGTTSYCVSNGSLPPGLGGVSGCFSLAENEKSENAAPNAAIIISGTPTQGGIYNFTVTANNGGNTNVTNYRLQVLAPVAASVSVSGRVMAQDGRGIRNAIVTMTDSSGNVRLYRTSSFGYFSFDEVEVGQTYVFQVISKQFTFAPQVLTINDDLTELNFTAQ